MEEIKYLSSWISVKLSKRLGQRGAEMVEYAIVLACVVVLGLWFYAEGKGEPGANSDEKSKTLTKILGNLWNYISGTAKKF